MRKFILPYLLSFLILFIGTVAISSAFPLILTYSGNNGTVGGWYIMGGGTPVPFDAPVVKHWQTANTVIFDPSPVSFQNYQINNASGER